MSERARRVAAGPGQDLVVTGLRSGSGAINGFLPPLPRDAAGWQAVARQAARAERLPAAAVAALVERQRALGAGPASLAGAARLAEPGVFAVVTGQQPGLYGGPLLSFHKAAGALALARQLALTLGAPVVPLFWSASEDHDFDEGNQLTVLDRQGQARRFALDEHGDRRSVADLDVPSESTDALHAEVAAALPETPRAAEALALLRRRPEESYAAWSARCLLQVFGDQGLVVIEPRVLAPWLGGAYAWLVRHGAAIRREVRASAERLTAAGLPAPVSGRPEDLPLFLRTALGGPRLRLGVTEAGAVLHDGHPAGGSLDDLARRVEQQPLLASADVVGRVFLQDRILPVLAYVGGPTELAYLAQVAAAHRALGQPVPVAVPRPSATWVEARALETAEAFGLSLEQVLGGAAPGPRPPHPDVERLLTDVREALEAHRRRAALLVEGGAVGAARLRAALERLLAAWEHDVPKIQAGLRSDDERDSGRFERLRALVLPRGRPQERTLSILTPLSRYGLAGVRAALGLLDPLADGHWLLRADLP